MRKGKILRQFKNFRIYKDLYGKSCKRDWMAKVVFLIKMLVTFGSRCNRPFAAGVTLSNLSLKKIYIMGYNLKNARDRKSTSKIPKWPSFYPWDYRVLFIQQFELSEN